MISAQPHQGRPLLALAVVEVAGVVGVVGVVNVVWDTVVTVFVGAE